MKELIALAQRAIVALEAIARRFEVITLAQYNYLTQSVDLADVALNINADPQHHPFLVTMNASQPIYVQLRARQDETGARYLDLFLLDGYYTIFYIAHLRAKTLTELQDSRGF